MTTGSLPDHYGVLGVSPDADLPTIRKAYRRLALEWHPDRNRDRPASHARMIELIAAWEILSDPDKRAHYDAARRQPTHNQSQVVARYEAQAAETKAASYPASWRDFEEWQKEVFTEITKTKNATPKFMFQFASFMVATFLIHAPVSEYVKTNIPDGSLGAVLINGVTILVSIFAGVLTGTIVFDLSAKLFPGLTRHHPGKAFAPEQHIQPGRRFSVGLTASTVGLVGMFLSQYLPFSDDATAVILGTGLLLLLGGLVVYLVEKNLAWNKEDTRLNHSADFHAHRNKWILIWGAVTISVLGLLIWTISNL